ncbi:MAG: hypothetical protein P9L94_19890 [Candidatus Hinthialibacter antarcticus]|nr:hypothetical protein [Candidatus Hinthialibacter antarcticus]
MNREIETGRQLEYSVILKRYGWVYIVIASLSTLSVITQALKLQMNSSVYSQLISILLFASIGYGMIKGKRVAFTLLYFVSWIVIGSFIMMVFTSRHVYGFVFVILLINAALFLPPLFLVRPYWKTMRDF